MLESPLLSIIVPVYNASKYLDKLITTIYEQSFTDWELLLINDGSTDNSEEICTKWVVKDPRIYLYSKKNGGQSSARNLGIEKSVGKYLYFADNDDELLEGCLQTLLDGMQQNAQVDLCVGKPLFSKNGVIVNHKDEEATSRILTINQILSEFFSPKFFHFGGPWSTLFKASIVKEHNLRYNEEFKGSEDRVFLIAYICHIRGFVYHTTKPIYIWNIGIGTLKDISSSYNLWYLTIFLGQAEIYRLLKERGGVSYGVLYRAKNSMINSYYDKRNFYMKFDDTASIKRIDEKLFSLISYHNLFIFKMRKAIKWFLKPFLSSI